MSHAISLRTFPAAAPIPSLSITPNIPQRSLAQLITLTVFQFIALISVILRVYVRLLKGGRFFLNDYAIFWAFFWATVFNGAVLALSLHGGLGQHIEVIAELVPERLPAMGKLFFCLQIIWAPANAGVKISIIDLYIQIFGTTRRFRLYSYVLMGWIFVYAVATTLSILLICRPFAFNWDTTIKEGHCGNEIAEFLTTGSVNLILDICVIVLPMPVLWGLKMPIRKKLGLALMFGIGSIICGVTIWRIVVIAEFDLNDPYYKLPYLSLTSGLEPLLGVINACLPVIRSVLGQIVAPFSAIKSKISVAWSTRGNTMLVSKRGPTVLDPSSVEDHHSATTRNFHRLYDHLYPLSTVGGKSHTADGIELRLKVPRQSVGEDKIMLTTAWDVHS